MVSPIQKVNINNKKPLGFGANNNLAMKIPKGDKILLFNSDALFTPILGQMLLKVMG